MTFIQFIGAIGIGAVLVKLLDILWLQKLIYEKERTTWLRDKRLVAYSNLSKELISLGSHSDKKVFEKPFELFAIATDAMLLIEDDVLIDRIDKFIVKLDKLFQMTNELGDEAKINEIYGELTQESREIIKQLRDQLTEKSNKKSEIVNRLINRLRKLTSSFRAKR
jgi:hypothetical protein